MIVSDEFFEVFNGEFSLFEFVFFDVLRGFYDHNGGDFGGVYSDIVG